MPPKEQAPYAAASPTDGTLRIEEGICSLSAAMSAPAGGGVPMLVTVKLTLYDQLPYVDLDVTHGRPADPWPEAVWICLPFKVTEPEFRLGRLGGIVDPAKDCVEGCNNEMFWLNSGMAVLDAEGKGAGLCPLDSPLVSLGQPGCWRYTPQFTPRKPYVFINLFNNQWTTNFRMWNGNATWYSRVRIWAIEKYDAEASLITPCLEARSPLLAAFADGPAGKLPATQSGLELSRKGVQVTAFGPNPDGDGTLLRLWELAGSSGNCDVRLPRDVKTVQPVDLRGRPAGQPMSVKGRTFAVPLRAFAPASFLIEKAEK
ncbi:MAG: hypothetical protein NTW87_24965 [Planctomycetota bacterium]|nr:hypothetical protein [Planctomycetota bacterium]